MSKEVLFRFTEELPEINVLKQEYKRAKSELVKVKRRIVTISNRYKFLYDIIGPKGVGDTLEIGCRKLFKELGFENVNRLKRHNPDREDLQICCDDCLIIIECKGSKNVEPPDAELNQIKRYIDYRQNTLNSALPVKGFVIINYQKDTPIIQRLKNPISKIKEEYAQASAYGIVTTMDLIKGFLLVKNHKISLEEFKSQLLNVGVIKFGTQR